MADEHIETDAPKVIVDGTKLLDEVASNMPDVVPDAVTAANEKQAEIAQAQAQVKDAKGRAFNPDIHEADSVTGAPRMTPSGRFRMKARQRLSPSGVNIPETEKVTDVRIKTAAGKFADIFILTGISFFGDEWKPEKSSGLDERQMLVDANEKWMVEHGYVEPPAWIDLLMAYGLYTGKRVFQPTTKSRIKILWDKAKIFSTNIWLKVTGQKIQVVSTEGK